MAYVSHLQLPYAIDPSNGDLRYMRNKIRHLLLPFLEKEFSPHVRRHLASLAETLRVEEDWLESLAAMARERVQDDPSAISVERLAAEPEALRMRILRQWLEKTGKVHDLGQRHIEHLQVLSQGQVRGAIELPGVLAVRRQRNCLVLESKQRVSRPSRYVYALTSGQEVNIPSAGWRIAMTIPRPWVCAPEDARLTNQWEAIFDIATLPATVEVRNFRSGDRIRPFGMQGHKKVHDIFIDAKVPPARRQLWPLIVSGAEVLWVPGCVRSEIAKVTSATRSVYRMTVNPLPEK
jgi:tRNA(Ile)-lysidine synthase